MAKLFCSPNSGNTGITSYSNPEQASVIAAPPAKCLAKAGTTVLNMGEYIIDEKGTRAVVAPSQCSTPNPKRLTKNRERRAKNQV